MRTAATILVLVATSCNTENDEPSTGTGIIRPKNCVEQSILFEQNTVDGVQLTDSNNFSEDEKLDATPCESSQSLAIFVAKNALRQPVLPEGFTAGTLRVKQNCLVLEAGGRVFIAVVPSRASLSGQGQRWEMALDQNMFRLDREANFPGGTVSSLGPASVNLEQPIPSRRPQEMFAIN